MNFQPRIRLRLTTWYVASVVILVLAAVLTMREWARRTIALQNEEATDRSVELVRSFFRAELSEYRVVEPTISHISGELVFAAMGIEFVRPDGSVVPAAPNRPRHMALRPPVRQTDEMLDPSLAPHWKLRLRISQYDLVQARNRIDRATLIVTPILMLLAAIVGWLVTGRSLRPVGLMADAAERITPDSRSRRLPISDANDEFGRLGRRFNSLLERLEGAMAQQQRFLADAAHELRTPIARMLGDAEVQLGAAPNGAGDRDALERLHGELARASSLVDELLQLARADSGAVMASLQPGYLDDVISDAIAPFERESHRIGVTLVVEALEEAPAQIDARLITRLLGVLLDNALHYTPKGGTVRVRVRTEGGQAILEIEDDGIGIPDSERPHIFERFYRGNLARQLSPNGSGLGLAIAAWIAHQHDGAIVVLPSERGGTVFRLTMPSGEYQRRTSQLAHLSR